MITLPYLFRATTTGGAMLLTTVLFAAPAVFANRPEPPAGMVGKQAPAFKLVDDTGKTHALEQYRGQIVVLEWVNPTCPFVVRHYKAKTMVTTAAQAAAQQKGKDAKSAIVWLAIDSSHFNTAKASAEFRKAYAVPYPVLQDPSGDIGRAYHARTTPQLVVIDAQGIVRYDGAIDDDPHGDKTSPRNHVAAALAALREGKTPSPAVTQPYGCSVKYKK